MASKNVRYLFLFFGAARAFVVGLVVGMHCVSQNPFIIPLEEWGAGFDRQIVIDILSKGAVEPVWCFECHYPDGSRGEAHAIDPDSVEEHLNHLGFVNFGGRMMMERIFELADALEVFLCWSDPGPDDEPNACVTSADRIDRVSADAKSVSRVAVVRDASQLNQLVKRNTFEENGW